MRVFDPSRIRERRERLGMTKTRLAKCAEITRTHMFEVERGSSVPTAGVIAKLAHFLRVRESYFFVESVSYKKRK
jgi:transcriptional regulator with XRE-family HTH domain